MRAKKMLNVGKALLVAAFNVAKMRRNDSDVPGRLNDQKINAFICAD
jgi:hypothetical protein